MKPKKTRASMKLRHGLRDEPAFSDIRDATDIFEILPRRLYFIVLKSKRDFAPNPAVHYFNTDDTLLYTNYYSDFGPLHLGNLFTFCKMLFHKLTTPAFHNTMIAYWTVVNYKKRANAAFLIGSFAVIFLNMSPRAVMNILMDTNNPYTPFRDANMMGSAYTIDLFDCFCALNKACYFNFVNFADFNLAEYKMFEPTIGNLYGDLSWIVPRKLIAFAGPCGEHNGNFPVENYINYFKNTGVTTVIRLNKSKYDSRRFTNYNIDHFDLYFPDGSTPTDEILSDFLVIVENTRGAIAVHCKAGLGRTGCLIGAYLMKHYRMTAVEAIAWMRIARPGCVIGIQQLWLIKNQNAMWNEGNEYRIRHYGSPDIVRQHKFGVYSIAGKNECLREPIMIDDKYLKIRERIKLRHSMLEPTLSECLETQGDLLVAARTANIKKNK